MIYKNQSVAEISEASFKIYELFFVTFCWHLDRAKRFSQRLPLRRDTEQLRSDLNRHETELEVGINTRAVNVLDVKRWFIHGFTMVFLYNPV